MTGEILDKKTEDAAEHEAEKAEHKARDGKSTEISEDGTESAGRDHRHNGKHGDEGTDEQSEPDGSSHRKHWGGSKSTEPAIDESSSL